jgi:Secretion system C-terminal sorting domain
MKKLLCFSLAFISYLCIANGQWQQQKMNVLPERSRDHVTKPMQSHHSNKDNLPVWNMKTNLFNTRSLQWNWDIIFTYDTLGGLMQRLTQTFDIHGNPLIQLTEQWQTNAWVNSLKETYTYDANGNMLTDLQQGWQTNAWVNWYIYTYTYDANGNCLTELTEQWQTNAWVNHFRVTFTYDANGNLLTFLEEEWQTNAWVNYWRFTYTYDANGNRLTELDETWQTNAWVNDYRNTYTYDANGNSITGKDDAWQSGNWEPGMGYLYLYSQKQYLYWLYNIYRYEAHYITITGIADIQATNSNLSVFPNPANDKITIEISGKTNESNLAIVNIEGQELIKQKISNRKIQIDISNLPSGVYFVRLTNDKTVEVGKFIKQ